MAALLAAAAHEVRADTDITTDNKSAITTSHRRQYHHRIRAARSISRPRPRRSRSTPTIRCKISAASATPTRRPRPASWSIPAAAIIVTAAGIFNVGTIVAGRRRHQQGRVGRVRRQHLFRSRSCSAKSPSTSRSAAPQPPRLPKLRPSPFRATRAMPSISRKAPPLTAMSASAARHPWWEPRIPPPPAPR